MDLADALALGNRELVSFVGAGGKKTAMANLVRTAVERGLEAGYTTTTQMPPPSEIRLIVSPPDGLDDALSTASTPVAVARERIEDPSRAAAKVGGFDPKTLDGLYGSGHFDWLLVKADGARRRAFKAPGSHEPVIPGASTHVVPVVSVAAVGKPLDERTVHRPERVAEITGLSLGEELTPEAVGTVLASESGGCKDVPDAATVTPLVNKADTPALCEAARAVVAVALERSGRFDRGLVCSLQSGEVDVVGSN